MRTPSGTRAVDRSVRLYTCIRDVYVHTRLTLLITLLVHRWCVDLYVVPGTYPRSSRARRAMCVVAVSVLEARRPPACGGGRTCPRVCCAVERIGRFCFFQPPPHTHAAVTVDAAAPSAFYVQRKHDPTLFTNKTGNVGVETYSFVPLGQKHV